MIHRAVVSPFLTATAKCFKAAAQQKCSWLQMLPTKATGMVAVSSLRGWRPFPLTVRDAQLAWSGLATLPVLASRDQLIQLLPWQTREVSMARAQRQEWGELDMGTSSVWETCRQAHRAFQCSRYMQESVNTHKCSYLSKYVSLIEVFVVLYFEW